VRTYRASSLDAVGRKDSVEELEEAVRRGEPVHGIYFQPISRTGSETVVESCLIQFVVEYRRTFSVDSSLQWMTTFASDDPES